MINVRRIVAAANWFAGHREQCNTGRVSGIADVVIVTVVSILLAVWLVHELSNCARAAAWC